MFPIGSSKYPTRHYSFSPPAALRSSDAVRSSRVLEIEENDVIWVYGVGENGILAFTDFGIESLIELIKMHQNDPTLLKRWNRSEPPQD